MGEVIQLSTAGRADESRPAGRLPVLHRDTDAKGNARFTLFDVDGSPVRSVTRWVRSLRLRSPKTAETYARNVAYFAQWLRSSGRYSTLTLDDAFAVMSRLDIEDWAADMKDKLEGPTLNNRECALKDFLDWLPSEDGGRLREPEDTPYLTGKLVTSRSGHSAMPVSLTEAEVVRLCNALHNESERCLVHLMFDCGLRISEVCRLRNRDLPAPRDYPDGQKYLPLHVEGAKGRGGRTKPRKTIISAPTLARVNRLHASHKPYRETYPSISAPDNLVFLSATGRPLSPRNVLGQLKAAAKRAGIPVEKVHPHVMRHSFALYLLLATDLDEQYGNRRLLLMRCLGHSSVSAGDVYAKLLPGVMVRASTEPVEKFAQAQRVYEATFLAPRKHTETRGHFKRAP